MGKSKDLATRVGIDDNADATAITITNQENVGIGTASPSNYGAAYTSLGVSGSSASAIEGFVGSNLVGYLQAYNAQVLVGSKTNVPLKLVTNDTIQMTIDGSGRVTMPNQPAFAATRNAGDVGTGQTYVYNNLYFNRGNHYNSSNGRFTAPVAGVYSVHTNHMDISGAAHTNLYYNILKNGSAYQHVYGTNPTAGTHHRWSWSGIIEMAVNDYLTIHTAGMSLYGGGNNYTNFSAALLG